MTSLVRLNRASFSLITLYLTETLPLLLDANNVSCIGYDTGDDLSNNRNVNRYDGRNDNEDSTYANEGICIEQNLRDTSNRQ